MMLGLFRRAFERCLAFLAVLTLLVLAGWPMVSEVYARSGAETVSNPTLEGADVYSYSLTFQELGRQRGLHLAGVDSSRAINFGIRADEVVKRLQLDLSYTNSPELLGAYSHLNVVLNGQVVKTLPLSDTSDDGPQERIVDLPPSLLRDWNQLDVQLIGHYTMACEDPSYPGLWATIGGTSRLLFEVAPVVWPNELRHLPRPFFDERDSRRLTMAFVLPDAGESKLEAAGTIASWFGALAGYRGAQFSVIDAVPDRGHAVIALTADDKIEGLGQYQIDGPQLSIINNPNDSAGKLLLVMGRDADELKIAASSLVLAGDTLSGPFASVTGLSTPQPRKPYDAPNWLPVDRPVRLGELLPLDALDVAGYHPDPIELSLRLPPDLFDWNERGASLDLLYRYSPSANREASTLTIAVNQLPIRSIDLDGITTGNRQKFFDREASAIRENVPLPLVALSSQASMQFQFYYPFPFQADCRGSIVDLKHSAIDPESIFDFSGLPHFAAMPDLATFATAGFPFTRMADLSETVIVLPTHARRLDYAAYLTLLGKIGESTGYPATGLSVSRDSDEKALKDKDVLLINSGQPSSLMTQWSRYWPKERDVSSSAMFVSFESPVTRRRTVVAVIGNSEDELSQAVNLMLDSPAEARLQGSLAVVRQDRIESLSNKKTYHIGSLGPLRTLQWYFAHRPLVLVLICVLGALLAAVVLYRSLQERARRRLRVD